VSGSITHDERGGTSGVFSTSTLSSRPPRHSGIWTRRAQQHGPDVWAIAGGKGGVGKSVVAANLALSVAQCGLRCLLVDADLGGGNQHTLFGERVPDVSLDGFISGETTALAASMRPSKYYAGLTLAYTRCDTLGAANPKHSQKQKLIRQLGKVDCDVVILDLGAGTSFNTLDLFLSARVRLVVTTPEPTAVQNAYGFIKCASQRNLSKDTESSLSPRIIVNLASQHEADYVYSALASVTSAFLGREPLSAGAVRRDTALPESVRRGVPLLAHSPGSPSAQDLTRIGTALLDECFEQKSRASCASTLARGMNEELRVGTRWLHIQTEDLGEGKSQIRTQVFESGRVIFSKELSYGTKLNDGRVLSRQQQVEYQHRVIAKALLERRVG
jgi:MinD-like ATPase involved in chromosome partitioning or flagellar assembly